MPIVIRNIDNVSAPVVVCDHCGQIIADAKEGNYMWLPDEEATGASLSFTHKECCGEFELAHPNVHFSAIGLECLTVYLAHNLNLDLQHAEECAKRMQLL